MKYPLHYRRLHSIKDIEAEKRYLKKRLKYQEQVISDNWEEIKKPFRYTNMAISLAGFLLPAKKGRWVPLILSGIQIAASIIKKRNN